jgi:hypothetical protein
MLLIIRGNMTNGINIGDEVWIPERPPIRGKVIEIDDHPLEYAEIKIRVLGAGGEVDVWRSCRLARKTD